MTPSTSSAPAVRAAGELVLSEDRYFDADPGVRSIARELYGEIRSLPLVCPHGHVDPRILADDSPFPEPTALIIIPDHYIFRMLYSRGISLESLGALCQGHYLADMIAILASIDPVLGDVDR